MRRWKRACVALALLLLPAGALAVGFNTSTGAAIGAVMMWLNASGNGQAVSSSTPLPVATTPASLAYVSSSTSVEVSHVLKASAGTFLGAQANNTSSTAVWVMLFDLASAPANGAVTPVAWWQVPPNSTQSISESPGIATANGIVLACSSTGPFTLTLVASCTFGSMQVQ